MDNSISLNSILTNIKDSSNILQTNVFGSQTNSTTTTTASAARSLNDMTSATTPSTTMQQREIVTTPIVSTTTTTTPTNASLVDINIDELLDLTANTSPQKTSDLKEKEVTPMSVGTHISTAMYTSIDQAIGNAIKSIRAFLLTPKENTLYGKFISKSENFDKKMDAWFENSILDRGQKKLDKLGQYIEGKFSGLKAYHAWLHSEDSGNWHMQVATYLVKLPLRAAQNIIDLLYGIISGILYTAVHPIKSLNNIARMIVTFIHELAQPETWSKMGVGMIAMEVGQLIFLTNPLVHISIGIGSALLLAGLSVGALKQAIINQNNEKTAVQGYLFKQCKELPEAFLTSLFMGMMMGAVQRAITPRVTTIEEARKIADKYIRKNNLPNYKEVRLKPNGKIIIDFGHKNAAVDWFKIRYPKLFNSDHSYYYYSTNEFRIVLPNRTIAYPIFGGGRAIGYRSYEYTWWDRYYFYHYQTFNKSLPPGLKF